MYDLLWFAQLLGYLAWTGLAVYVMVVIRPQVALWKTTAETLKSENERLKAVSAGPIAAEYASVSQYAKAITAEKQVVEERARQLEKEKESAIKQGSTAWRHGIAAATLDGAAAIIRLFDEYLVQAQSGVRTVSVFAVLENLLRERDKFMGRCKDILAGKPVVLPNLAARGSKT